MTFTKLGLSTEGGKEMKSHSKGNGNYHIYIKLSLKVLRKKRISLLQCCRENVPLPKAERQCHYQRGSKLAECHI